MASQLLFDLDSLLNYSQVSTAGFDFIMGYTSMTARQGHPFGRMEVTRIVHDVGMGRTIEQTLCIQDMGLVCCEDHHEGGVPSNLILEGCPRIAYSRCMFHRSIRRMSQLFADEGIPHAHIFWCKVHCFMRVTLMRSIWTIAVSSCARAAEKLDPKY